MAALELSGVTVRLGARVVLDAVDLAIAEGERVAILGPNGSGKTTLLRVLAGFLVPDAGRVRPAGELRRAAAARAISFLPQEEHWEFPFAVEDVVRCGRYAYAVGLFDERSEDVEAVESALAAVGMVAHRGRPVTELSGGERRRAVLARALAQRAPALLLDEPTTALDLEHRHAVLRVLSGQPGTVVFSTHDLDAAAVCAQRLVVLDGGRIVADGAPADVLTPELLERVFHVRGRILREDGIFHVVTEL